MIGGQHQHDGVRIAPGGEHGGNRDRGAGVATHRLQHDVGFDAALAQLLGDHEAEIGVGDDDRPCEQLRITDAREHLLEGRGRSDQPHELLGHALARHRP